MAAKNSIVSQYFYCFRRKIARVCRKKTNPAYTAIFSLLRDKF
jgi:hypothetical protein